VAGIVYFTGTLYWITRVMVVYGGITPWAGVLINAALILYLSLFPAIFAAVTGRIVANGGSWALMAAPFVWVASEVGRTYVFTGFPWVLLGYSQTTVLPIAQLASLTGVYGVSLLVAAVSAAAVIAFDRRANVTPLAIVFAVIVGVAAWGSRRVADGALTREGEPITVGLLQGNVDQAIKWEPAQAAAIFQEYIRYTRQAIFQGAGLVIWPESSIPFRFEDDPGGAAQLRAVAQQARVPIVFGSDQIDWRTSGNQRVAERFYNSAFLLRADGSTGGVYRKMHLVPFGEYVPLQKLFFFAAPLTEQVGTFSAGQRPDLLTVNGHPLSVAICYEVVYPALVRQFVTAGSELLTTITNDAWFGPTSAPYQHFEQAAMRAIEEGRYLVRSANTGISGIVDPYGRVLARTGIYEPAVVVGTARFLRATTPYARFGDIAAYLSIALTVALLLVPKRRVQ
jgi:apolipoprotein N-acyltransferase